MKVTIKGFYQPIVVTFSSMPMF